MSSNLNTGSGPGNTTGCWLHGLSKTEESEIHNRGRNLTRLNDGSVTLNVGRTLLKVEADNTILFKSDEGVTGAIIPEQYGFAYAYLHENRVKGSSNPQLFTEVENKDLRESLIDILGQSTFVKGPEHREILQVFNSLSDSNIGDLKEEYSAEYLRAQRGRSYTPASLIEWAVRRTHLLSTVHGTVNGGFLDDYKQERLTMPLIESYLTTLKTELQTNLDPRGLVIKDTPAGGLAIRSGSNSMQVLRGVHEYVLSGNVYGVLRAHHLVSNTTQFLVRKQDKATLPDFGVGQALLGDADRPLRANIDRMSKHLDSLRGSANVETLKPEGVKARRAQHVSDMPIF